MSVVSTPFDVRWSTTEDAVKSLGMEAFIQENANGGNRLYYTVRMGTKDRPVPLGSKTGG